MLVIPSLKKHERRPQTQVKIFICLLDYADQETMRVSCAVVVPLADIKMEPQNMARKALI